jgi:hypothetical protein
MEKQAMSRYVVPAFLLVLTIFSNTALAQDRWYDVELVVFKHAKAEHFFTEQWPTTWSIPDTSKSVDPLNIQREFSAVFSKLPQSAQTFSNTLKALETSSRYDVLAYRSWLQMGLDKNKAVNIRIQAGKTYSRLTPASFSATPRIETGALFEAIYDADGAIVRYSIPEYALAADNTPLENIVYELDGNIKIVLSRFLHVYTDLLLLEPVVLTPDRTAPTNVENNETGHDTIEQTPSHMDISGNLEPITPTTYKLALTPADTPFTTLHGFNIRDHRRMRSNEQHHLDHPLVGIIIKITPAKN